MEIKTPILNVRLGLRRGPGILSYSGLHHSWTHLPLRSPAVASSPQKVQPTAQGSLVLVCVSSSFNNLPDEDPLVSLSLISGETRDWLALLATSPRPLEVQLLAASPAFLTRLSHGKDSLL